MHIVIPRLYTEIPKGDLGTRLAPNNINSERGPEDKSMRLDPPPSR